MAGDYSLRTLKLDVLALTAIRDNFPKISGMVNAGKSFEEIYSQIVRLIPDYAQDRITPEVVNRAYKRAVRGSTLAQEVEQRNSSQLTKKVLEQDGQLNPQPAVGIVPWTLPREGRGDGRVIRNPTNND